MAYDEELASRLRLTVKGKRGLSEKNMFGGLAIFLNGNMTVGLTNKDELMLRVGKDQYEEVLEMEFAKPMTFTGRAMKGLVFIEPEGFETETDLGAWVDLAFKFTKTLPKK
jgi:TfoX/Sxy family transcriptional regulator of competence genes